MREGDKRMDTKIMRYSDTDTIGRPLIISYSYSGHTHRIAQEIQDLTGGDWREIYPWQPYPMAFPELLDQVKKEIQTGYHPRLLPSPSNPKPYSVVFAGAPNWCGTLAPPLASWLAKNNLSHKIILPFYSHCGGVPCDFRWDIARLCPQAEVRQAFCAVEDGGDGLREALIQWMGQVGLAEIVRTAQ